MRKRLVIIDNVNYLSCLYLYCGISWLVARGLNITSALSTRRERSGPEPTFLGIGLRLSQGEEGRLRAVPRRRLPSLREKTTATGPGTREVDRPFVDGILAEAAGKRLVPRPFRDEQGETEGICFCCDDCCSYFTKIGNEQCDKGKMIESTNAATCINCGTCVEACRFGAREFDGELRVDREKCYGCGVCVDACPDTCITMAKRAC